MKKVNPLIFKNKLTIEFLPTETLIGVKVVNCDVLCEDDLYHPVIGIEVGFIFFTISYVNMPS
jgi:hypothetical protein|tara:strand:- start:1343 stop:1531 length:189 start_codon:yes stop_codon:yes gene_type:complete